MSKGKSDGSNKKKRKPIPRPPKRDKLANLKNLKKKKKKSSSGKSSDKVGKAKSGKSSGKVKKAPSKKSSGKIKIPKKKSRFTGHKSKKEPPSPPLEVPPPPPPKPAQEILKQKIQEVLPGDGSNKKKKKSSRRKSSGKHKGKPSGRRKKKPIKDVLTSDDRHRVENILQTPEMSDVRLSRDPLKDIDSDDDIIYDMDDSQDLPRVRDLMSPVQEEEDLSEETLESTPNHFLKAARLDEDPEATEAFDLRQELAEKTEPSLKAQNPAEDDEDDDGQFVDLPSIDSDILLAESGDIPGATAEMIKEEEEVDPRANILRSAQIDDFRIDDMTDIVDLSELPEGQQRTEEEEAMLSDQETEENMEAVFEEMKRQQESKVLQKKRKSSLPETSPSQVTEDDDSDEWDDVTEEDDEEWDEIPSDKNKEEDDDDDSDEWDEIPGEKEVSLSGADDDEVSETSWVDLEAQSGEPAPVVVPKKSVGRAYLFWLFGGLAGAHRYYVGKWASAFTYTCSIGFLGVGWLIDLFLVPFMVKDYNRRVAEEAEKHPDWYRTGTFPTAEWAEGDLLGKFQVPFRAGFFIFGPMIFVLFALMLNQVEMAVLGLIILFVTGFMGSPASLERNLNKYPALGQVPVLGDAVEIMKKLHEFYYKNKPGSLTFYMLYPITAPMFFLFSKKTRREFAIYWKIIVGVALVIIIETIFSYPRLYPPHLQWSDAVFLVVIQLLLTFFMVTGYLMPMVSSSYLLNFSGHHKALRLFTAAALVFAVPAGIFTYVNQQSNITYLSSQRLMARLDKESFQKELTTNTDMFLKYHRDKLKKPLPTDKKKALVHPYLTKKYQRQLGAILVDDETNAFQVVVFGVVKIDKITGFRQSYLSLGIKILDGTRPYFLYVTDDKGKLYRNWEKCPRELKKAIQATEKDTSGKEWKPLEVYRAGLLDEFEKIRRTTSSPGPSKK